MASRRRRKTTFRSGSGPAMMVKPMHGILPPFPSRGNERVCVRGWPKGGGMEGVGNERGEGMEEVKKLKNLVIGKNKRKAPQIF